MRKVGVFLSGYCDQRNLVKLSMTSFHSQLLSNFYGKNSLIKNKVAIQGPIFSTEDRARDPEVKEFCLCLEKGDFSMINNKLFYLVKNRKSKKKSK
jgi:hypothetical protein